MYYEQETLKPRSDWQLYLFQKWEGIKCHIWGNFRVSNSLFAENKYGMRHGVGNTGVEIVASTFLGYTDDSESRKGRTTPNGIAVRTSYNTGFFNGDAAMSFTNVVSWYCAVSTHYAIIIQSNSHVISFP